MGPRAHQSLFRLCGGGLDRDCRRIADPRAMAFARSRCPLQSLRMSSPPIPRQAAALALPALVLGSIAIGASPIFVRLSELGPVATAFHRMLWALPPLYLWVRIERYR